MVPQNQGKWHRQNGMAKQCKQGFYILDSQTQGKEAQKSLNLA